MKKRNKTNHKSTPEPKHLSERRKMLKVGTIGTLAAITGLAKVASAEDSKKTRYVMVIDLRRCSGCQSCAIACKSEFEVPLGVWRSWVKETEEGKYPKTKRHFLPRLCNHCDNPPCIEVCPVDATFQRPDGAVLINDDECIGCELCIPACPYNARYLNPDKKIAEKCTLCVHRVDNGVVPSCVNTCPGNARIFGDMNDPDSEVAKLIASEKVKVLNPEIGTDPRVYYIASDDKLIEKMKKEVKVGPAYAI